METIVDERSLNTRNRRGDAGSMYQNNGPILGGFASETQYPNRCARLGVFFLAFVLIAGGATIITLSLMSSLSGCDGCGDTTAQEVTVGSIFVVIGLCGLLAAGVRRWCTTVFFCVLVVLLAIGLGVLGFVLRSKSWSRRLWKEGVREDPGYICATQHRLSCSGFDYCCGIVVSPTLYATMSLSEPRHLEYSGSLIGATAGQRFAWPRALVGANHSNHTNPYPCGIFNSTPAWYHEQCAPKCNQTNHAYTASCASKVQHEIDIAAALCFSAAAVFLLSTVAVIRMNFGARRESGTVDETAHLFGPPEDGEPKAI